MRIENNRPVFYTYGSLLFSISGWMVCLGGHLWASLMTVKVTKITVIPDDTFVRLFFTLGGAICAAVGLLFGIIAYIQKVRTKKLIISLLLSGLLAIPMGVALVIGVYKSYLH